MVILLTPLPGLHRSFTDLASVPMHVGPILNTSNDELEVPP